MEYIFFNLYFASMLYEPIPRARSSCRLGLYKGVLYMKSNPKELNDKPVVVDERMIDSYQNLFNLAPRIIEDYDAVEVLNQLKS